MLPAPSDVRHDPKEYSTITADIRSRRADSSVREMLVIGCCFFLSGFSALVLETVWSQQLILVFGSSQTATAAVLAAYMGGLAVGAGLAVRWLPSISSPLHAYALLELGIGVSALLLPLALAGAGRLQRVLLAGHGLGGEGGLGSSLFHLGAAFVILGVPTACMGATLPLLARHLVRADLQIGPRVGALYTVNTLGAATGALTAAFLLLPAMGLGAVVDVAVAVNLLVFVMATIVVRAQANLGAVACSEPCEGAEGPPQPKASAGSFWVLPAVLVSGLVALGYEVLWTRLLGHVLGGSLYAFGTMLFTFLIGIALGSAVAARLTTSRRAAQLGFVLSQLGVALVSALAYVAADSLPLITRTLDFGSGPFLLVSVLCGGLTLLPAAVLIGAAFPFAVRIRAAGPEQAGAASAQVYAWNTLGAIAGAVGTGFLLLPAVRIEGTAAVLIAMSLVLALVMAAATRPRRIGLAAAAGAGLIVLLVRPLPIPSALLCASPLEQGSEAGDLEYYGVGRSATVILTEQGGDLRLTLNGLLESLLFPPGERSGRNPAARWLAMAPVAARPQARSMAVIGFGGGITVESVPRSIEKLDVIELEPEVIKANCSVAHWRFSDPLADPRLRLHFNDARSALQLSDRRFDIIVSQPSHPWTAAASNLFTREFFQLVRARLTPDGVLCQWIGLMYVDEPLLRSLVATLNAVFPYVELYQPGSKGVFLLLASPSPIAMDQRRPLEIGPWQALGVTSREDIVIDRRLDAEGARKLGQGAPLITDYRNLLQVRSPRVMADPMGWDRLERILGPEDPLKARMDGSEAESLYILRRLLMEGAFLRASHLMQAMPDPARREVAAAILGMSTRSRGRHLQRLWDLFRRNPDDVEVRSALLLAGRLEVPPGPLAGELAERMRDDPVASAVMSARQHQEARQYDELKAMDPELAQVPVRHPLYNGALQLRIAWRCESSEPASLLEAIALQDRLLAVRIDPWLLLSRTQVAEKAGSADHMLAGLLELAGMMQGNSKARRALLPEVRRLWRSPVVQSHPKKLRYQWLERAMEKLEGDADAATG